MVFEDSPRSGSSDLEAETSELAQPTGGGRCLVAVGGVVVSTVTLPQYGGRSRSRRGWRRCEDESRIDRRPSTLVALSWLWLFGGVPTLGRRINR